MDNNFYSTGQAAQELGISPAHVRALCESGLIRAEITSGGQWRIPAAEVARLKRDGVPAVPRPMPEDGKLTVPRRVISRHPALYAEPSEEVIDAAEEVIVLEHEVKALALKRQREEQLDWFLQRAAKLKAEEAAKRARERARFEAEEAQQRRQWRDNHWLEYALDDIPRDARGDVEQAVHDQVQALLHRTPLEVADGVIQRLVDAIVTAELRPWRRQINKLVGDAVKRLPSEAWSYLTPTEWQIRATQQARVAIEALPGLPETPEIEAAAKQAVEQVALEFRAQLAAREDAKMRQAILYWTPLIIPWSYPATVRDWLVEAIKKEFSAFPVGTPRDRLEKRRDEFLAEFDQAVRQEQVNQAQGKLIAKERR